MKAHSTIRLAVAGAVACFALSSPCLAGVAVVDGDDTDKATKADDLERMSLNRPAVPVTRGRGAGVAVKKAPVLPADGSAINELACVLVAPDASGWHVVRFDRVEGKPAVAPRRVLPCRLLEQMEALAGEKPGVHFRIWGENAVYGDQLYILPLAVTIVRQADPALDETPPAAAKATDPKTTDPKDTSPPAAGEAETKPTSPSIDDVAAELLKGKAERAVVVPNSPDAAADKRAPSVAPGARPAVGADRGAIVIDRLVRIASLVDGARTWQVARFEADNTLAEPPLRLLPCHKLTLAESLAQGERQIRVTGRTTYYKGRRYLLLRKVLPQRRLGRF